MNKNEKLNDYLTAWDLSNPRLLAQTMTSHIYTVVHDSAVVVLKLLSSSEVDEQRGALALRYFDGRGAVRLLRYDDGAQLMEYASGDALVTLVEHGEDEKATRIIAQVIKQLHSIPQDAPKDGMVMLDRWFEALFVKAAADRQVGVESIFERGAALAEQLLTDQREIRVLHGDIHHYNIKHSPRGWLAFDPKGVVGERTYDCANALCNPVMPELVHNETRLLNNAAILADALELELRRVLAFAYVYACLNASWWTQLSDREGAEDIVQWYLDVAKIIEPHIDRIYL
ncbi:MAG: aminoglycoside phosphotransferase family protein [Chloroflexota bacterium]|nr:aminoglycoside phosphotransferase family protein [Anaerolineales bacterium]